MSNLFTEIKEQIKGKGIKIVLPEAKDARILAAASQLAAEGIVEPILIGDAEEMKSLATGLWGSVEGITKYNPETYPEMDAMVEAFVERRKGKVTVEEARELLKSVNYFGAMLVYMGKADGLVSGGIHSTGDTVRPALQIIKTKPGVSRTSGVFLMVKDDEKLVMADCAININPAANELAEIAVESAKTAEMFGVEPKVAMLSFSTLGSAKSVETEKVAEATKLAKEMAPDLVLDGEFQFDTAYVQSVAIQKAPGSVIHGDANVFVFPTLDAGNIGYKIAQRLGGYDAIGPILQGLNMPVNDLSRGCTADDVYKLSLITAAQVVNK